jgi:hypothetical protein
MPKAAADMPGERLEVECRRLAIHCFERLLGFSPQTMVKTSRRLDFAQHARDGR